MVRILVVDDDDAVREVLGESLQADGHEVRTAADGERAIRSAAEWPPDVVVTDILMPGKEGLETIIELRRGHPGVKIIAISGGGVIGPEGCLVPAQGLGADRCLAKPFRLAELAELIGELTGGR